MKRALIVVAALGGVVGCGSPATEDPAPAPPAQADAPRLVPKPGVDLAGPIAAPSRSARRAGTAAGDHHAMPALDLVSDRAVVALDAPRPPRGGAVAFHTPDERAAWIARIPEQVQLPAVAYGDGRVYVSGGFESVSYYALDAATGQVDWMTSQLEDNGPTAAVYDDGRVVFNTESCTLFALDAKSGKRLWFHTLGDPTLAQIAVADGLVFASHPDADAGGQALSAYRVATGDVVWSRPIASELLGPPVIAGDSVYATTAAGVTYRVTRATGRLAWARDYDATAAPWVVADEVFLSRQVHGAEQQIVVAADSGALVREQRAIAGKYVWDVPSDATDSKAVWAFEGSRPVIDRGVRYVAMGGAIRASDAASGEPMWERRYAGKEQARSVGSVALAGSEIVVATREGRLFGLDIDTGYTLWSYDLGHRVVAEPIVAKGWVYAATTDGYVIAVNVADPTLDGWHMFGGSPGHDGATSG
jgi:Ca-activated chloride channel family protein|nr:PQQ-binding-like beta-propeller repeat protein [Kofleriaceae bacterium]